MTRIPPTATSAVPIRNGSSTSTPAVSFAQILLKNSNFRGDHNSEDRWQPRWKFPRGLSGATDLSAYDPLLALAVASTRGDNAFRAEVGFSRHLNFRLFQQYRRLAVIAGSWPRVVRETAMRNGHRSSRCGIGRAAAIAAKLDFRSREIRSASAFAIVRFVEKILDRLLTSSLYGAAKT
jgi:hypothetical protein